MKIHHKPQHWILVALVLLALLLTLSEAHGQTGAGAVFEGRPAMAGAQAGQGALAGPPQGGIGAQGTVAQADNRAAREEAKPARDPGIKPARDPSVAKDERTVSKAKRTAKRVIKRARTGVGDIDAARAP